MFPLKQRQLIRGCQAHITAGLGCGADYVAKYVDLYLPFDGTVELYSGVQGGKWLRLIRSNGDKIEFAHLDRYFVNPGFHKQGTRVALTGNTGEITTGPHLHAQIFNPAGQRLDPEKYKWEESSMTCEQELAQAKEEIRKLNTEIGVVTQERDIARNQLIQEKQSHKETLEKLTATEQDRDRIVEERNKKFNQIKAVIEQ